MTITAKPVLEDKFWIVEEQGVRIGTLSKNDDGFLINTKGKIDLYKSENQLKRKFGKNFLIAEITSNDDTKNCEVNGFPTKCSPFNSMYDIKRKLPLFTKSEKSRSVYCAGYYLIKFNVNWLKSFCPNLITIERNNFIGPFKTELEMKAMLKHVNRAD